MKKEVNMNDANNGTFYKIYFKRFLFRRYSLVYGVSYVPQKLSLCFELRRETKRPLSFFLPL